MHTGPGWNKWEGILRDGLGGLEEFMCEPKEVSTRRQPDNFKNFV